jgi:Cu/Ag efflux protein CusF
LITVKIADLALIERSRICPHFDLAGEGYMKRCNALWTIALAFVLVNPQSVTAQDMTSGKGIDAVEVTKTTATVEKIDLDKRKITLLSDDGKHKTLKVDPRVTNLDQVKVGDRLQISLTDELILLVGKSKADLQNASSKEFTVSPKGTEPSVSVVDTTTMTARILAVDGEKRRVTIEDSDGKKKTIKLSKDVTDLDQLHIGDTVEVLTAQSLVVGILK